jgi:hypothetical protein
MENDIEIVIPPKREFDRLDLILVRYEDDPKLEEVEYFDQYAYWQIKANDKLLAYGYGWLFGKSQLDYYAERFLEEPYNISVRNEEKQISESTKALIAKGAFGGPNAPTAKERWEQEKKDR